MNMQAKPQDDLTSFPVPHPAFHRMQYGSDEKLGVGLGTRLMCAHTFLGAEQMIYAVTQIVFMAEHWKQSLR